MNILKKSVLTLTLIATALCINAQSNSAFVYGIKGGLNLAELDGYDGEAKTAFSAGLFTEYLTASRFAFRTETYFSVQGAKSKTNNEQEIKLNYLQLPVLVKYYLSRNLSAEVGPNFGFLLSGKGGQLPKSAYETFDFGVAFGASIKLSHNLELGARYNLGVTDVTKTPQEIKNSVLQFTLSASL